MQIDGYAYFIRRPASLQDLLKPCPIERKRPFEVVKSIVLHKIDYENFITDMLADREFIEKHALLCATGTVWKCLFAQMRNRRDGVLVVPQNDCYVGWASYLFDR